MLNSDIEESIERYIVHIRRMNLFTDEQLTLLLRQKAIEDPSMFDALKDGTMKKAFAEMKRAAKDIGGNPVKWARKVDDLK